MTLVCDIVNLHDGFLFTLSYLVIAIRNWWIKKFYELRIVGENWRPWCWFSDYCEATGSSFSFAFRLNHNFHLSILVEWKEFTGFYFVELFWKCSDINLLLYWSIQNWLLSEDVSRDTFVAMNREGIFSFFGYLSLYYFASNIANFMYSTG